jgi:hypothetical protein
MRAFVSQNVDCRGNDVACTLFINSRDIFLLFTWASLIFFSEIAIASFFWWDQYKSVRTYCNNCLLILRLFLSVSIGHKLDICGMLQMCKLKSTIFSFLSIFSSSSLSSSSSSFVFIRNYSRFIYHIDEVN